MNTDFKYILQPYKNLNSRITCPSCKKPRQFTPYIDQETNKVLSEIVGRCNREIKCGYHYTPKQYFNDNDLLKPKPMFTRPQLVEQTQIKKPITKPSYIPFDILKRTRKAYNQNNLIQFLFDKIGEEATKKVLVLYHIGTSKHWFGASIFWQIDFEGKVRTGKVMLYDKLTGHRIKKPYPHITWIHKLVDLKDYQLNQCLFGEHLLSLFPEKPTAIVESEKTAILAAAYQPTFNWLAAGNLNNLSRERCKPLKGKTVFLFPDAGAFNIWSKKAKDLKDLASFIVSDLIEKHATPEQMKKGFDLADYFEGNPKPMFTRPQLVEQTQIKKTLQKIDIPEEELNSREITETNTFFEELEEETFQMEPLESWPIEELETFFSSIKIPEDLIQLNKASTINNPKEFIKNQLTVLKANNGKKAFIPYFERLLNLKEILSK